MPAMPFASNAGFGNAHWKYGIRDLGKVAALLERRG